MEQPTLQTSRAASVDRSAMRAATFQRHALDEREMTSVSAASARRLAQPVSTYPATAPAPAEVRRPTTSACLALSAPRVSTLSVNATVQHFKTPSPASSAPAPARAASISTASVWGEEPPTRWPVRLARPRAPLESTCLEAAMGRRGRTWSTAQRAPSSLAQWTSTSRMRATVRRQAISLPVQTAHSRRARLAST